MKNFFKSNIDHQGRLVRGILGMLFLIAGVFFVFYGKWIIGWILIVSGLFMIIEAASKWCVARACGIKTKL